MSSNIFIKDLSIRNGVHIAAETDYYWGILPRALMQELNVLSADKGPQAALQEFDFKGNRFDYASEPGRADFLYFLPITDQSVVLDLGSGYGNIARELSRHVHRVVAADATYDLLRFSKMRADAEGVRNIDFVHIDPLETDTLPFEKGIFDVIILNGVLEWVGSGVDTGSPTMHQTELLKRLARLLKDDGVLCVSIENRLHPAWWVRDPHSKLPLTAVLPRFLADRFARFKGMVGGYRTYIYSYWGYQRLFARAGFRALKWFYPFSTYRSPQYIYGDDARPMLLRKGLMSRIFTKKWQTLLRLVTPLRLDHVFLSSFTIIARRTPDTSLSYGQRLLGANRSTTIMVKEKDGKRRMLRLYDEKTGLMTAERELE